MLRILLCLRLTNVEKGNIKCSIQCETAMYKKMKLVRYMGLDSDLIMLSVFHCDLFRNIFIFRETPEFGQQFLPKDLETSGADKTCLFMDIQVLTRAILSEMHCGVSDPHRIYDYVFLCFFLGNDFLPHFPFFKYSHYRY